MKENKKKQAMIALKKKVSLELFSYMVDYFDRYQKYQEQLLEKSQVQLDNIQQMVCDINYSRGESDIRSAWQIFLNEKQ